MSMSADGNDTMANVIDEIEANERHIFALGLAILLAWTIVIIVCAAPQV